MRTVVLALVVLGCFCRCSGMLEQQVPGAAPEAAPEGAAPEGAAPEGAAPDATKIVPMTGQATASLTQVVVLEPGVNQGCSLNMYIFPGAVKQTIGAVPGGCAGWYGAAIHPLHTKAALWGEGWLYEVDLLTGQGVSLPLEDMDRLGYDGEGRLIGARLREGRREEENGKSFMLLDGQRYPLSDEAESAAQTVLCQSLRREGGWTVIGTDVCYLYEGQHVWDILGEQTQIKSVSGWAREVEVQHLMSYAPTGDAAVKQELQQAARLEPGQASTDWMIEQPGPTLAHPSDWMEGPLPLGPLLIRAATGWQVLAGLEQNSRLMSEVREGWLLARVADGAIGLYDLGTGQRLWSSTAPAMLWPEAVPVPAALAAVPVAPVTPVAAPGRPPGVRGERPRRPGGRLRGEGRPHRQ